MRTKIAAGNNGSIDIFFDSNRSLEQILIEKCTNRNKIFLVIQPGTFIKFQAVNKALKKRKKWFGEYFSRNEISYRSIKNIHFSSV